VDAGLANLLFLGFLIAIFYFLLIRPQKKRQDAHRRLIESVGVGDEIVTIGGFYGTVRHMGDDEIELEISPGTTMRMVKSAIARRITEDVEESAGDTGTEETA
jgi:preprotein translocase subunit YajC